MPEGDTILRSAGALRNRLAGAMVTGARPAALARLQGRRLIDVDATGKHLTLRFEGGIALHTHMRMTGSWHLYRQGEHWRRPAHRATCALDFGEADAVAVLFSAPVCELVRDDRAPVAHLGPDILAGDFDVSTVIPRARAASAPTLGELLLDQRVCAGIGNIYKCESLWLLRLDPWAAPAELDDPALARVYGTARELMRRAVVGDGRERPRAVHGRGGRPCRRCGSPIAVRAQGEQARLTYWCRRCQAAAADPPPREPSTAGTMG